MTEYYEKHLHATIQWLKRSSHSLGGSSAYFRLYAGWNKPYPETTGYIIPTLLNYSKQFQSQSHESLAVEYGDWLLNIQNPDGSWNGGFYPPQKLNPSVFNTGQILLGLLALHQYHHEAKWEEAAHRGANWLVQQLEPDGLWEKGHYGDFNPTYYTRIAWPILAVGKSSGDSRLMESAIRVLDKLADRRNANGTFSNWGFKKNQPAFTHTIAYTIRGFIEASLILDDWEKYGGKVEDTLNKIYTLAELNRGRLAGAYDTNWEPVNYYSCLTGNVQLAICLMKWHEHNHDLRLVNAASKLIDYVCDTQYLNSPFQFLNGAVAGSNPIWGRYLIFRYPNWAAKFHADALMMLLDTIKKEQLEWSIKE